MFFIKKQKLDVNSLRLLFDAQKKTLVDNNYSEILGITPQDFNDKLEALWQTASKKINGMEMVTRGEVPLLLVVEHGNISQKIDKIKGHTELNLMNIEKSPTPVMNIFSLLLDVEDGRKMVAKSPKDALKKFEKEKRFALTIDESIALLTHYPNLLKNNYLIVAGSFYTTKDNESLPLLWLLDEHGNPELHYAWLHIAHGSYGTGSYAVKM